MEERDHLAEERQVRSNCFRNLSSVCDIPSTGSNLACKGVGCKGVQEGGDLTHQQLENDQRRPGMPAEETTDEECGLVSNRLFH